MFFNIQYSNARSIKTRIETVHLLPSQAHKSTIRMQDPLKQGLKLMGIYPGTSHIVIRMQDPLKQGLKLIVSARGKIILREFECKIH